MLPVSPVGPSGVPPHGDRQHREGRSIRCSLRALSWWPWRCPLRNDDDPKDSLEGIPLRVSGRGSFNTCYYGSYNQMMCYPQAWQGDGRYNFHSILHETAAYYLSCKIGHMNSQRSLTNAPSWSQNFHVDLVAVPLFMRSIRIYFLTLLMQFPFKSRA